ncbi:MAG TPA: DUF1631 family protein, partial [Rhodanobacter sp.]
LALTLLQHGENSPAVAQRLRVTDQLLGRLPVDDADLLRREVQAGLQQIGMHAEEAGQVALRLVGAEAAPPTPPAAAAPLPAPRAEAVAKAEPAPSPAATPPAPPATDPAAAHLPDDRAARPAPVAAASIPSAAPATKPPVHDLPSATDLALRLKQRQRLGESQHARAATATGESEPPLGPQEARIHNRLRQLPYGSWFEFTDPATGETTRRKLAWFSPVTGNSLFVTRRGLRGEELNLRELARAMAAGQVRELPPQRDGLLDRAWQALTGTLRTADAPLPGGRP